MSDNPTWTLREMTEGDLPSVRGLYKEVWGYNRPESFDRWRWLNTPDGICPGILGVDGDRVVGSYTIWPVNMRIGDARHLGAQSMDTMTHPDYQGQGMFTKLAAACYELAGSRGFELMYGFPNPLSYPGFVKRLAWKHTGDVTHWIRPLRLSAHPKIPGALGPVLDFAVRLFPKGRPGGMAIRIGRPEPEQLSRQLENWHDRLDGCMVERTLEWMDWRYNPAAQNDYEWVCAYDENELAGFGVWGRQISTWGAAADSRAHLVELAGNNGSARQAVLASIIDRAAASGAILIETLTDIAEIAPALRRAGFFRHRQAPLIVRSLTGKKLEIDINAHENWQFIGGDIDTF